MKGHCPKRLVITEIITGLRLPKTIYYILYTSVLAATISILLGKESVGSLEELLERKDKASQDNNSSNNTTESHVLRYKRHCVKYIYFVKIFYTNESSIIPVFLC